MNYHPAYIANFFLGKQRYSNYVLNKLVYVAYGFCLAIQNRELFSEKIEAWKYGPVIPSLYHRFSDFGNAPIKTKFRFHSRSKDKFTIPEVEEGDYESLDILEEVYETFGSLSEADFQTLTHHQDSPWEIACIENKNHVIINENSIKQHFRSLLPIRKLKPEIEKLLQEDSANFVGPFDNTNELITSLGLKSTVS